MDSSLDLWCAMCCAWRSHTHYEVFDIHTQSHSFALHLIHYTFTVTDISYAIFSSSSSIWVRCIYFSWNSWNERSEIFFAFVLFHLTIFLPFIRHQWKKQKCILWNGFVQWARRFFAFVPYFHDLFFHSFQNCEREEEEAAWERSINKKIMENA